MTERNGTDGGAGDQRGVKEVVDLDLDGLVPVGSFLLLSHLLMYTLVFRYLQLDFDDATTAKIGTDGLMPSAGIFLLAWIISFNAA